jgi:hypothetical protein
LIKVYKTSCREEFNIIAKYRLILTIIIEKKSGMYYMGGEKIELGGDWLVG